MSQYQKRPPVATKQGRYKAPKTRCEHCSGVLRLKGAGDVNGGKSWKCRKCGRRKWEYQMPKPPTPLVPQKLNIR